MMNWTVAPVSPAVMHAIMSERMWRPSRLRQRSAPAPAVRGEALHSKHEVVVGTQSDCEAKATEEHNNDGEDDSDFDDLWTDDEEESEEEELDDDLDELGEVEGDEGETTTFILQNVPTDYTRTSLVAVLDQEGFAGDVDFVFVPASLTTGANWGHAFLNFVTPEAGRRFRRHFHNFKRWPSDARVPAGKRSGAKVVAHQNIQGLWANIEAYRNCMLMHHVIPDEYRPMLMRNGERMPFPRPTRPLIRPRTGLQPIYVPPCA